MKRLICLICVLVGFSNSLKATSSTFVDVQNFNRGYCPDCNCYPCCCQNGPPGPPIPPGAPPPPPCAAAPCGPPPPCGPRPNPCCPAPVCGTQCGLTAVTIGILIAAAAATAAIIISTNNGDPGDPGTVTSHG